MEKAKHISIITFQSIWLGAAALFYFLGLYMFKQTSSAFGAWMLWGAFCVPVIIPFILRTAKKSSADGARQGANTYTASSYGNTISVSNHPFMGAVIGFFLGIFVGIAAGPIAVPSFAIKAIGDIVKHAVALKRGV